jgi:hypothetical protein
MRARRAAREFILLRANGASEDREFKDFSFKLKKEKRLREAPGKTGCKTGSKRRK